MYDQKRIQMTEPFNKKGGEGVNTARTIYYGEVVSIEDKTDGGRIKVKVLELDGKKDNSDVPYADPIFPKYFHIYPKVGEMVRVFIMDSQYPNRNRFWMGSVISQLQKIEYDSIYSALSTTDMATSKPLKSIKTNPNSDGVFPEAEDVAIIGRVNTDIILKKNQVIIRAGKHFNSDIGSLNTKNSASLIMSFDPASKANDFYSNSILFSNKIALLTHDGSPNFKSTKLTKEDRETIFKSCHPIGRGDVIVYALDLIRKAIVHHKHGYSNTEPLLETIINDLEKFDFDSILQKNIVIN